MFVCLPFLPLSSIAHTRIVDCTPLAELGEHNKKIVSFLDGIVTRGRMGVRKAALILMKHSHFDMTTRYVWFRHGGT